MNLKLIGNVALLSLSIGSAFATPIVAGPNTVILDNFNGSTTGTAYGALSYASSMSGFGQAGQFGPGNYVQYTIGSLAQGTIEMWVNSIIAPSVNPDGLLTVNWANTAAEPASGYILHFGTQAPGVVRTAAWPSGGATGTTSLNTGGVWTHLAASWGAAGTKVYVNGVLDGSSPTAMNIAFNPVNYVYLNYWGNGTFTRLIDELQISNIQLVDAVIASHAAKIPVPSTVWLIGIGVIALIHRQHLRIHAQV